LEIVFSRDRVKFCDGLQKVLVVFQENVRERKANMISIKSRSAIAFVTLGAVISFSMSGAHRVAASIASRAQASAEEAPRIKPEEVRELLKKGKAVLVDVRGEASYKAGHIKGALNIPYADIRDRAKELPRDKMIVTYCS
jgi:Rhodanese-like domain